MPSTIHQGATGFDVTVVQLQLNLKNAAARPLRVDGGFGPLTQAALLAFQSRSGLVADGIAGPRIHAALAQGLNLSTVHHAMTHIAQPTNTTCWAASTAMMTRSTVAAGQAKTPADMVGSSGGLRNSSGSDHTIGPEVVSHRQPPTDQTPRCAPSDRNIIPIGSYEAVPSRCRIILPPLLTALLAVLNLPQKGWSGYGVKSLRWFPRGASRLASCGVQL